MAALFSIKHSRLLSEVLQVTYNTELDVMDSVTYTTLEALKNIVSQTNSLFIRNYFLLTLFGQTF